MLYICISCALKLYQIFSLCLLTCITDKDAEVLLKLKHFFVIEMHFYGTDCEAGV